jgi:hypothetical protein
MAADLVLGFQRVALCDKPSYGDARTFPIAPLIAFPLGLARLDIFGGET